MAKAIRYRELGGPDVLTLDDVPDPVAGSGEVVIRVEAAGVNPIDTKLRAGVRKVPGGFDEPRGTGKDGAGVIVAVGEGVEGFREGDPVAFWNASGSYATELAIPAQNVFARPGEVSAEQAAALGVPASTAYQALRSLAVREDDTLLIHAGSGSVGQAAIQFAVLSGARVLATSSERRAERIRDLGAEPVEYGEGLTERVQRAAPDGVTVILDAAGTDEALETSLQLLEDRDRIATIVRGADAASLGIQAYSGGSPEPLTARQEEWRAEGIPVALALIAAGAFDIELGERFGLERAADAHRASESGSPGKLIITP